jgi:hypothetical protein
MRTRIEELYLSQRFREEVLIILGGHAAGLYAPVVDMTGKRLIDPVGVGERYEVRRIQCRNGPVRALVATTMSDVEASRDYLGFILCPRVE